jgi:hypothetical protein
MVALGILYLALSHFASTSKINAAQDLKKPHFGLGNPKNVKLQVSYTAHLLTIYAFSAWNRVVLRVVYLVQLRLCSWVTS